jgi:hypothetical protein
MQYCKHYIILCCAWLFCATSFAQEQPVDMTGLWTGLMFNDTTELNYRYEIAISEKNGRLTGYSQTFFILDGKEYYGVKKIKITIDGDKVITQDMKLLRNNYPIKPPKGVYVVNILNFEKKQDALVLSGMFETNRTREYAPATGYVHVEKKIDFKQSPLVQQLKELGLDDDLSFIPAETPVVVIAAARPVEKEVVKEQPVAKTNLPEKEKPVNPKAVKEKEVTKPPAVTIAKEVAKPKEVIVKTEPKETIVKTEPKEKIIKTEPKETIKKSEPKETVVKAEPKETVVKTEPKEAVVKSEPAKIPETKPKQPATDIKNRIIETIQSVNYTSDSLMITLYDNGEVDGDTVSVIMNGNIIMPMVGLGTNAVRKTIYTKDITDSIQIVMYAENLGTLPPNTGLLIVNDGKQRYEIRFSGDLKKNAAIVFKKKSPL